jgi:hypothetical protein
VAFLFGLGGAVAGAAAWAVVIAVTTGVCSIPVLNVLWCTVPTALGAVSVPDHITWWDMFLLIFFVGAGAKAGWAYGGDR